MRRFGWCVSAVWLAVLLASGCASTPVTAPAERTPAEVRAQLVQIIPAHVADRAGWAADIEFAFTRIDIPPTTDNLCAVLAVIEQETGYRANPEVPGLARIARAEIDRRAATLKIPKFAVDAALELPSGDGRSFRQRIAAIRTEKDMSDLFTSLIARVPLGERLFADANPVRTGGSMQVSIAFAEAHAATLGWPQPDGQSIRDAVFTRRGGVFFGTAHLLEYPNSYTRHLYRYADFNAGWYASRNAAFQQAVASLSGHGLVPDGDLRIPGQGRFGPRRDSQTELALFSLAPRLGLDESRIRADLALEDAFAFEQTDTWNAVFRLADTRAGKPVPRAVIPKITLKSPKITRTLTTEWFANRVQGRYQQCINRAYNDRRD